MKALYIRILMWAVSRHLTSSAFQCTQTFPQPHLDNFRFPIQIINLHSPISLLSINYFPRQILWDKIPRLTTFNAALFLPCRISCVEKRTIFSIFSENYHASTGSLEIISFLIVNQNNSSSSFNILLYQNIIKFPSYLQAFTSTHCKSKRKTWNTNRFSGKVDYIAI